MFKYRIKYSKLATFTAPNETLERKNTLEWPQTWDKSLESGMEGVVESEVILFGHQTALDPWRQMMEKNDMRMRVFPLSYTLTALAWGISDSALPGVLACAFLLLSNLPRAWPQFSRKSNPFDWDTPRSVHTRGDGPRRSCFPLSAYNIVQEFTYQPNHTFPAVFLGNLVPSVLHNPTDSFSPQIFHVGDTILLENRIFNYTIAQAFDSADPSKPVSAFSYYNNPLSDSCDVANITIQLLLTEIPATELTSQFWTPEVQVGGTVACYIPSPFYLTWSGLPKWEEEEIRNIPAALTTDIVRHDFLRVQHPHIEPIFSDWDGPDTSDHPGAGYRNITQAHISLTAHPCCDCDAVLAGGPLENRGQLLQTPCSSNPLNFVVIDTPTVGFNLASSLPSSLTPTFSPGPRQVTDVLAQCQLTNISIANLGIAYGNIFQAVYHLVRLDLGVILENQIYNSPEMFNRTIMPVDTGGWDIGNRTRDSTSNTTYMAQWQKEVEFFENNTRVPLLEYVRSVPRLKPPGSAVTSVFVSTFAMLSVMWTVFSLVAAALARKHSGNAADDTMGKKHTPEQSRMWEDKRSESGMEEVEESQVILLGREKEPDAVDRWRQRVDNNDIRTRVALARISAALKKHGIMEDEDWLQDNDTTME
ncbi:hypothetical protein C8R45DRAFT_1075197 [Mycena sanguinolenta]|nr:hypothetical protein C8R45DRAFT_1075197 [Mycena sanguinolenta]